MVIHRHRVMTDDDSRSSSSNRRRRRGQRRSLLPRRPTSPDGTPPPSAAVNDGMPHRGDWIVKPHPPAPFTGLKSAIKSFVHSIDCALAMNPPTTNARHVAFVSSFLQGSARTWLAAARLVIQHVSMSCHRGVRCVVQCWITSVQLRSQQSCVQNSHRCDNRQCCRVY